MNQNVVFCITLASVIFWAIVNQNSDILFGTIIGSSLFQLLAVNGINKLTSKEKDYNKVSFQNWLKSLLTSKGEFQKDKVKYRSNSQYLVICSILLLFLAADYLLKGKYVQNELNKIDGGILIMLFVTYLFLMRESIELEMVNQIINFLKGKDGQKIETDNIRNSNIRKRTITYIILGCFFFAIGFLVLKYISRAAIMIGVSQYVVGLSLMAWYVCFSSFFVCKICDNIILRTQKVKAGTDIINRKYSNDKKKIDFEEISENKKLEGIIGNSIVSITLFLGIAILFRSIFINTFMIYHLIFFGIVALLLQLMEKIDSRIAGSGMAALYIGFIIFIV